MWLSRCGRRSGIYEGRRISRSILKIVRVARYGWKMLSSIVIPLPLKARRFLRRSFPEEIRAEGACIKGTPQKGLRTGDATIGARRWPDFYSRSWMIDSFETGLKVQP